TLHPHIAIKASFFLLDLQLRTRAAQDAAATLKFIEERMVPLLDSASSLGSSFEPAGPRAPLLLMSAAVHLRQGDFRAAKREAKQALQLQRQDPAGTMLKAHIDLRTKSYQKAARHLVTALREGADEVAAVADNNFGALHSRV